MKIIWSKRKRLAVGIIAISLIIIGIILFAIYALQLTHNLKIISDNWQNLLDISNSGFWSSIPSEQDAIIAGAQIAGTAARDAIPQGIYTTAGVGLSYAGAREAINLFIHSKHQ